MINFNKIIYKNFGSIYEYQNHIVLDNEFFYDPSDAMLFYYHEMINLTQKESDLLALLIKNKNKTVDLKTIKNTVLSNNKSETNSIKPLVKKLKEKLKDRLIYSDSSGGYQLNTVA